MAGKGRGIEISRHWVRWVVRVMIETGSGMDYDMYTEDYTTAVWNGVTKRMHWQS